MIHLTSLEFTDFEVLGRTDGRTIYVKIVICGRPCGSKVEYILLIWNVRNSEFIKAISTMMLLRSATGIKENATL